MYVYDTGSIIYMHVDISTHAKKFEFDMHVFLSSCL